MKKSILKLMSIVVLTATIFTGCSSDDDSDVTDVPTGTTIDPNNFQGTFTSGDITLNAGLVYKLTGKVQINNGVTLNIPAGTKIEATGGTSAYIAIAQGGKLNVSGTASNPVIMTSGLAVKSPGDWGGLVICGKAPINTVSGGTATAQSEVGDLPYGGTTSNDNSGSINYLRIEYAGAAFSSTKEFNGASLFGVGSGTTFRYVQTYHGADDGFEFFGGSVNTSYLISFGNEDDQFDWTEGWNGTNTNWYGKINFGKGNRGIEADNYELGFANTPISNPTITNLSLVGPGSTASAVIYAENSAIKVRRGTKGIFTNVSLNAFKTGFDVENDETIAFVGTLLKGVDVIFTDVTSKTKGKDTAGVTATVTTVVENESATATGAGNGALAPTWSTGWSIGL